MKPALILASALFSFQAFAQLKGGGYYTRNVAPQPQRPAAPVQGGQASGAYGGTAAKAPSDADKAAADKTLLKWQQSRAEGGSDSAQYEMGMRYLYGKGVEQNDDTAREWFEKAAKNGNSQAKKQIEMLKKAQEDKAKAEKPKTAAKPAADAAAPAAPTPPAATPAKK